MANQQEKDRSEQLTKLIFKGERAILDRVEELHSLGTLPRSLSLLQSEVADAKQQLNEIVR